MMMAIEVIILLIAGNFLLKEVFGFKKPGNILLLLMLLGSVLLVLVATRPDNQIKLDAINTISRVISSWHKTNDEIYNFMVKVYEASSQQPSQDVVNMMPDLKKSVCAPQIQTVIPLSDGQFNQFFCKSGCTYQVDSFEEINPKDAEKSTLAVSAHRTALNCQALSEP